MENNKYHQIKISEGRIVFPSLAVVDGVAPKYEIRSPYELVIAIIFSDERYNHCFLLHFTVPTQSGDQFIQIISGKECSTSQQAY